MEDVFSLIPDPTKLTTKIGHYNKAQLRDLRTLFLCTVSIHFIGILIITPWVCGVLISKILMGAERWVRDYQSLPPSLTT